MSAGNDLLEKYKTVPFAKGLLPFIPALNALNSPFAKICAKPDGKQRWVVSASGLWRIVRSVDADLVTDLRQAVWRADLV